MIRDAPIGGSRAVRRTERMTRETFRTLTRSWLVAIRRAAVRTDDPFLEKLIDQRRGHRWPAIIRLPCTAVEQPALCTKNPAGHEQNGGNRSDGGRDTRTANRRAAAIASATGRTPRNVTAGGRNGRST